MTAPVRLRLSRRKGFELQAHSRQVNGLPALKVTRPGAFGNPYVVAREEFGTDWFVHERSCHWGPFPTKPEAVAFAVELYRRSVMRAGEHNHRVFAAVPTRVDIIKALRGHNLACFCQAGTPCHADTLLEIANGPLCEAAP